ncbi:linoleate diol synthase [Meredithblackwellia eburnea MCA 4105]
MGKEIGKNGLDTVLAINKDIAYQTIRGEAHNSWHLFLQVIGEVLSGGKPMDDRQLLLEHGVSFLQNLPPDSALGKKAADELITFLWNDLPHPPASHVGPSGIYRAADGSGNNKLYPDLGKSGRPYARSVPAVRPKPQNLPDPGLVFDYLLRRPEGVERIHPSGMSSFFFAFATIVIHECFQTSATDHWINETTSYVDLSTLYGVNQAEQDTVRTRDGKGTLWNDCFASKRLMLMTPPVIALLIAFSRNHNSIAHKLLELNQSGKYKDPSIATSEELLFQDEDIFQLARNINVAWFAHIVLGDYVSAILNTVRANSSWSLDLGGEIIKGGKRVERGGGNEVSVEFNRHHWHASMSKKDADWITYTFKNIFGTDNLDNVDPNLFYERVKTLEEKLDALTPKNWTFRTESGEVKRGEDGRFDDAELAGILNEAVTEPAFAFGANGSPAALRAKVVEMLGMYRARAQNVCTMNEFRRYLNLKEFSTFEEWNPDPAVAAAAKSLYHDINDLELYPGLLAELSKPAMPGSGVCAGHTIGRGILDDAVSLVRSDRFLSESFNTSTLTSWGKACIQPAAGTPGGGYLANILYNAFPFAYDYNSTFALLPFYTPTAAKEILKELKVAEKYNTETPTPKQLSRKLVSLKTYDACAKAFQSVESLGTFYNDSIGTITDGRGFFVGFDETVKHNRSLNNSTKFFYTPNFEKKVAKFVNKHFQYHVKLSSKKYANSVTRQLDVVRDICNVIPIEWIATRCALPIKSDNKPLGLFTLDQLRQMLVALFVFSSMNVIPKNGFQLREASQKFAKILIPIIEARIATSSGLFDLITDFALYKTAWEDNKESEVFYKAARNASKTDHFSIPEVAGDILGLIIPIAGNITQQTALITEFYLRDERENDRKALVRVCAREEAPDNDEAILGFIHEAMRHVPVVIGLPREAKKDQKIKDGDQTIKLKTGDRVIIGTSQCHLDDKAFPNPEQVNPKRWVDNAGGRSEPPLLIGSGLHVCFGKNILEPMMVALVRQIFRLKNLRRDPAPTGKFTRVTEDFANGLEAHIYLAPDGTETPAPTSLTILVR